MLVKQPKYRKVTINLTEDVYALLDKDDISADILKRLTFNKLHPLLIIENLIDMLGEKLLKSL